MKRCIRCGETKEAAAFSRHAREPDGLQWWCKECVRAYGKTHVKSEHSKQVARANASRWAKENPWHANSPAQVALRQRWAQNNRYKKAASKAVQTAIRQGKVIPWPVCAVPECDRKPEAHHADYSRPLDVVWLCRSHHKQAHALVKLAA